MLAPLFITSCTFITHATVNEAYRSSLRRANSELAGWRFVIDPGHGGIERGAVAAENDRVTEAEVNLIVSLLLGGMLEASGADVSYTRKADIPVSDQFESLPGELRARSAFSNALDPDFFISIHHNSSAKATFNKIEVYHKLMTQGAATDLAASVASELSRLYPDLDTAVIAGNFSVIRNAEAEGLLIECAYLSNKAASKALISLPALRLEADAIYEAILSFSRGGNPRIRFSSDSAGVTIAASDHVPIRAVSARFHNGSSLAHSFDAAPDSASFTIRTGPMSYSRATITCTNALGRASILESFAPRATSGDTRPLILVLLPEGEIAPAAVESPPDFRVEYFVALEDPSATLRAVEHAAPKICVIFERAPRESIAHYWRSQAGERLARSLSRGFGGQVAGESHYFLNHTSMAAVVVKTSSTDDLSARLLKGLQGYFSRQ